jgi:ribonuclease P protein component
MKDIAIKEHHLYNKTYKRGKSFVGGLVVVYVLRDLSAERLMKANPQKRYVNRVGLSVSKKLGGAVVRNRVKRILRAGLAQVKGELKTGYLIVLSARGAATEKKSGDIARELRRAFRTLGMLENIETQNNISHAKE